MRCLIIERPSGTSQDLAGHLIKEGLDVELTSLDPKCVRLAKDGAFDVIILNDLQPARGTLLLLLQFRKLGMKASVIVLSEPNTVEDRIEHLNASADDYLGIPFDFRELTARIRAITRCRRERTPVEFQTSAMIIDTSEKSVSRDGNPIHFTAKEYVLLEYLAQRSGQTVPKREIFKEVYGDDSDGSSNVIVVCIGSLRKKLNAGGRSNLIHTRRGSGYILSATGDASTTTLTG